MRLQKIKQIQKRDKCALQKNLCGVAGTGKIPSVFHHTNHMLQHHLYPKVTYLSCVSPHNTP